MATSLNRTTYTYDPSIAPPSPQSQSQSPDTSGREKEKRQIGHEPTRQYLLDVNPYAHSRIHGDGMNIIDARWIDTANGLYIDITGLSELNPDSEPGIWSCKNFHKYRIKDLYPMRESVYEGVKARIPYAYDRILLEEYAERALVATEYEGHTWDERGGVWVKTVESPLMRNNRKQG